MSDDASSTRDALASRVRDFYDEYPYPAPSDDVVPYGATWDDARRRADSYLFWPAEPGRDDRSVLVAGCGTRQAAHYALRWPKARVLGIDFSASSLAFEQELKRTHRLDNLELRELPIERAGELRETFDHVVCTGVLHHLADPDAGLGALGGVLAPDGALHLMLYAPYGRAGIYLLQDYCRRLGIGTTDTDVRDLAATLKALPQDHPIVPLLRNSPDFATIAGLADALLHPNDRSYSVPQLLTFLQGAQLVFGRWIRQAPYLPFCGAIAASPHAERLFRLSPEAQYAAMELFRGTMVRHSCIAYRTSDAAHRVAPDFDSDAWLRYVPTRLPEAITVRENLPPGASAVLINPNHTSTDLYLPIDGPQERLLAAADGTRTIADIVARVGQRQAACAFFRTLWLWDQVVFGR
ncbi:MAG: class I SAM-dependent methyltransferase [Candidatus Eremiobacteraeota bacterium]|nr:class I SAM-dependent methyltransferase [Candidatus Eremiobacteraeota bacterium]MBV8331182.1 class I SAM-dependent methyltransferase [Candidatus Eremiobacteraeota bacterium]MBV8433354.1 class I SAM-dependent methyltransferase [Candidatus Eremiobacteraeota bacterium]MBV8721484.1 class I SAM-dependent methyltransferase [Candidatus Eremiobacteraeota bacterium]